ncbi:hypothetical protein BOQ64_22430 [Chryseobacterium sp. CH25]|nr:hypothetical protein BOQ64_22430 [Chryseobacterium sp. CH25]RXM61859.1 hypothetical protein BOQ60_23020 [Chryseobacterium sp. CH1]
MLYYILDKGKWGHCQPYVSLFFYLKVRKKEAGRGELWLSGRVFAVYLLIFKDRKIKIVIGMLIRSRLSKRNFQHLSSSFQPSTSMN